MATTYRKHEIVRNPYNYDADDLSNETALTCNDESLTEQQHAKEADINYIADVFMRTGEIKQVLQMPTYGDFQGVANFQDAMNLIVKAKNEFQSLPPKIRSRFANDPQQLIAFLDDPANRDEAIAIGLIPKPATMTTQDHSTKGDDHEARTGSSLEKKEDQRQTNRGTPRSEGDRHEPQKPRRETRQDD